MKDEAKIVPTTDQMLLSHGRHQETLTKVEQI